MDEQGITDLPKSTTDLDANQSLSKALQIIKMLSATEGDIGVRELGRRLSIPPSVVHRLLATLKNHDFVEQDPRTMRYRVGFGLYGAGQSYLMQRTLADAALEELQQLSMKFQMSAYLGVLHDTEIVYFLSLPGAPMSVNPQPGRTVPIHTTALGKVILAGMDSDELEACVRRLDFRRHTDKTVTDIGHFLKEVETCRIAGYATCLEENLDGIFAVGVPVHDERGDVVAAISLGNSDGPEFHRLLEPIIAELHKAAGRISEKLGRPVRVRNGKG
ncbi:IclR family transcriptional regulator [Martelella alba]|uniref:IclR family transcriptional regulator n=1 Tax=Martelella alba TaxID=2590451 RepID=A0A506UH45_9HYPH|nr:IclR family transcriptional regulator [Martelella alba]TPW32237.1 IclR family transcriptional regulator [Martelella alba]